MRTYFKTRTYRLKSGWTQHRKYRGAVTNLTHFPDGATVRVTSKSQDGSIWYVIREDDYRKDRPAYIDMRMGDGEYVEIV